MMIMIMRQWKHWFIKKKKNLNVEPRHCRYDVYISDDDDKVTKLITK